MTDGAETPILKGLRELASHLRPKFRTQGARFLHLSRNDFDRLRDEVAPLPEHAYAKRHWPQFVFVDEIRVGLSPLLGRRSLVGDGWPGRDHDRNLGIAGGRCRRLNAAATAAFSNSSTECHPVVAGASLRC
jgi:hypothetical protein